MKKTTLLLVGIMSASAAVAQEAQLPDNTVRFTEMLNNEPYRMYDWSEKLLQREIAKNPANVDLLRVQLAATYFKQNKDAEGNAAIKLVLPTSPAYADAQMALGVVMYTKGRYDEAAKYLEAWRKFYKDKYAKALPSLDELESYRRNFGMLLQILIRNKDIKGVRGAADELADLEVKVQQQLMKGLGPDDDPPSLSGSNTRLFGMISALDILEERLDGGGKVTPADVTDIIKSLEKLFWSEGNVRDQAAMQKARALLMAGDLKGANTVFTQFKANIDAWEETDETGVAAYEGESLKYSPKAAYRHYYGLYCKMLGDKATDPAVKKREYGRALNYFYACLKINKGYDKEMRVLNLLLEVNDGIAAINDGKRPLIPEADPVLSRLIDTANAISDKARDDYEKKNFPAAIQQFLKGYSKNPNADDIEQLLVLLTSAYAETGKTFEATLTADLAALRFPNGRQVAQALLLAGVRSYDKQRSLPPGPEKNAYMNDVLRSYSTFLALFPAHQNAPDAANLIANDLMSRAGAVRKLAVGEPDMRKKSRYIDESREMYLKAAEAYERIITNFRQKPEIVNSAYYYRGNCLSLAEEFMKSNEAFEAYCKSEKNDIEKLANAKYLIGDNYFSMASKAEADAKDHYARAGRAGEEDAKPLKEKADALAAEAKKSFLSAAKVYEELVGPFHKGALKSTSDDKVTARLASAKLFIAWSYDGAGDKKTAIKAFDEYLKSSFVADKQAPLALSRMAILYAETDDAANAAKFLSELVTKYPESPQGKEARYLLGTSMYNIKEYGKAVEAFNQMFNESQAPNIPAWQWILANMITYPDKDEYVTPEMAKVAVKAGKLLVDELGKAISDPRNPKGKDWFTADAFATLRKTPSKMYESMLTIQERLWLNLGKASLYAQMYDDAVRNFSYLVSPPRNKTRPAGTREYISPYLYEALRLRGEAYTAAKKFDEAQNDFSDLAGRASSVNRYDIQRQAICGSADASIAAGNYKAALDVLSTIVDGDNLKVRPEVNYPEDVGPAEKEAIDRQAEEQFQAELKYIEYAAYRYAFCAAKLGLTKERDAMVAKYRKNFGNGRYGRELTRLPAAEGANQP